MSNVKKIASKHAVKKAAHKSARPKAPVKMIHYVAVEYDGMDGNIDSEVRAAVGKGSCGSGSGYCFINGRRDVTFDFETKAAMDKVVTKLFPFIKKFKKVNMTIVPCSYKDE